MVLACVTRVQAAPNGVAVRPYCLVFTNGYCYKVNGVLVPVLLERDGQLLIDGEPAESYEQIEDGVPPMGSQMRLVPPQILPPGGNVFARFCSGVAPVVTAAFVILAAKC